MKITELIYSLIKILLTKGNLNVTVSKINENGGVDLYQIDDIFSPSCYHHAKNRNYIELYSEQLHS